MRIASYSPGLAVGDVVTVTEDGRRRVFEIVAVEGCMFELVPVSWWRRLGRWVRRRMRAA